MKEGDVPVKIIQDSERKMVRDEADEVQNIPVLTLISQVMRNGGLLRNVSNTASKTHSKWQTRHGRDETDRVQSISVLSLISQVTRDSGMLRNVPNTDEFNVYIDREGI